MTLSFRAQINHAKRHATHNVALLRSLGYKQIGRGAFSRVLVHPDAPDVVIKVGTYRHATVRDVQPPRRLPVLRQNAASDRPSKFYPKIYHIEDDGEHFVVVMKRYTASRRRKVKNQINGDRLRPHEPAVTPLISAATCAASTEPSNPRNDRFSFDLHGRNIMQDEHGTPILTDPIAARA